MSNLSLQSRMDNFATNIGIKRKSIALKLWKAYHSKQSKLNYIKNKIETERHTQIKSQIFCLWFDASEEKKTMRLLNDAAIGLHKDKVLTQIFVSWHNILPLLKREKLQLLQPRLVLHFYQWRKWSADNNDLRDKLYEFEVRKMRHFFDIYRVNVEWNKHQRNEGHSILAKIDNAEKLRIGLEMWRDASLRGKQIRNKYMAMKQRHDANKSMSLFNDWKLLFEVTVLAKTKKLSDFFKTWRREFGYVQKEHRIRCSVYYYGIKKRAFTEWRKLLHQLFTQRNCFHIMLQKTNQRMKLCFFVIWRIHYQSKQLLIKTTRTKIKIRIEFWRNYAKNRMKSRKDLLALKERLTDQWKYYQSSIYEHNYFDDDGNDESDMDEASNGDVFESEHFDI